MANPGFQRGRPPCGGWPMTRNEALKSCYQHRRQAESRVPVYGNVTKVTDYRCPPSGFIGGNACAPDPAYSGGGIFPYSRVSDGHCVDRAYSVGDAWPDCTGANPDCTCPGCSGTCDEHDYGSPQCNAWKPYPVSACTAARQTQIDFNCYELVPNSFVDLSLCRKIGFKNAQGQKAWHGRFGYMSHDHDINGWVDLPKGFDLAHGGDGCTDCNSIEFEQFAADQTKYLFSEAAFSWSLSGGGPSYAGQLSAGVDRYSGVQTYVCIGGKAGADFTTGVLGINAAFGWTSKQNLIGFCFPAGDVPWPSCGSSDFPDPYNICWDVSFDGLSTTVTTKFWVFDHFDGDTPVFETKTECVSSVDASAGTASVTQYGPDADNNWVVIYHEDWTFTNTDYTGNIFGLEVSTGQTVTGTATGHLDNPYTASQLYADLLDLLKVIDLSNDIVYPWRLDNFVGMAPTATRSETPGATPPGWSCADLDMDGNVDPDPNALLYDGSVLGAMTPYGGVTKGHFDFQHVSWRGCVGDDGATCHYPYAYGACAGQSNASDATDGVMPKTATRWTQNFDGFKRFGASPGGFASSGACLITPLGVPLSDTGFWMAGDMPAGAWLMYSNGILYGQKWAEIKIHRPSYNFARPCGPDRFLLNEPTVRCVVTAAGSPLVLTLESASGSIAVNDLCFCCSVDGVADGVYKVTAISGPDYTVTPQAGWPAAPSGELPPIINCGTGIFGKLRWAGYPGICGTVFGSFAAGTPIQVTTGGTQLVTGDQVNLEGVPGLSAGPYTITVIDRNTFTLNGTSSAVDLGGGYIKAHGAVSYRWDDDQSKGDFFFVYWNYNFRDFQERQRVVDRYALCDSCAAALPGDLTPIRPNQAANGMPQQVNGYAVEKHCLKFTVCDPQVLFIGPNHLQHGPEYDSAGHSKFANVYGRDFPNVFPADERYGAKWQASFVQTITDPLWQTPHRPCEPPNDIVPDNHAQLCAWLEDNCPGCCEDFCDETLLGGDGPPMQRYYAHRPLVEAVDGVPAQFSSDAPAPTLPPGIVLHYLTFAEMQSGSPPAGNVLPPPAGNGYVDGDEQLQPVEAETPWSVFFDQAFCVCGSPPGQFAENYEADGVAVACPS
jgi:hypothetical protein